LTCKTDRYIIHNYLFNKIKTLNTDYKINEFTDEQPSEPIFNIFDILDNIIIEHDSQGIYEKEIKKIDEITDNLRDALRDKFIFLSSWSWRDANKNKLYENIRDFIQNILKKIVSLNDINIKKFDIYKNIINSPDLFKIFNDLIKDEIISRRIIDYLNINFEKFKSTIYEEYKLGLEEYNKKFKEFNEKFNLYKLTNSDKDLLHNTTHEIFKIKSYWNTHKNNMYLNINDIRIDKHNFTKYFHDDSIEKPITMIENFIYISPPNTLSGGFNYYKKYLKYKNKYIKLKNYKN